MYILDKTKAKCKTDIKSLRSIEEKKSEMNLRSWSSKCFYTL